MARQNKVNIVIPSYMRAGKVAGYSAFKNSKICIPESQRDDYLKHYSIKRLIVIPDKDDGNISKKRNWILKNVERPLLMIDDDVSSITMSEKRNFRRVKTIRLNQEQAQGVIVEGFNLAHQLGCVFWGVNQNYDPISYQQFKPITLTQCVLGPFSAHLWHDLLYDERLPLAEDYDFSLQVLQKYKKILRYNRFATYCRHNDNPGGVVAYRTNRLEIENCKLIMRKWGENVIKYKLPPTKPTDVLNARVHVPIKGV